MTLLFRAAAVAGIVLAFAVEPVQAQQWRYDLGALTGFSLWSPALDEDRLGSPGNDVKLDNGLLAGLQATFWVSPQIGLRAGGIYTDRPLTLTNGTDTELLGSVKVLDLTGDVMIRFITGGEMGDFMPYLALGGGLKRIDPEGSAGGGAAFTVGANSYLLEETSSLQGLAALGTDLGLSPRLGLRFEVGDRFFEAPVNQTAPGAIEGVGNKVHQVYVQLGVHARFGVEEPPVEAVAVVPPPPPPPPPAPPPPPPEEQISVCVVDPAAPGGLKVVDAIYMPETRDTLVQVGARRAPFQSQVPRVVVAPDAEWFVAGQPLSFTADERPVEFVAFGGAREIEPAQLAFVGTVGNVPVYADAADIEAVRAEVEALAREGSTLESILSTSEAFLEAFEAVQTAYVPLQATGCIFQPLSRVEEVRKGGK